MCILCATQVSKHYRTLVISYSAEGSITNSHNQDFPFFFRTIAENKQYRHAYLAAMQKFGWKQVLKRADV